MAKAMRKGSSVLTSYVISVSLGTGCYRHIRIGGQETLEKLHKVILNAFDFEDDHAHCFFMDNRYWSGQDAYYAPLVSEMGLSSAKITLQQLRLTKGDCFKYLFDFGDEWRFQCKVLRELPEKTDLPEVIRQVGEAPEQYPDFQDDAEFEDADLEFEDAVILTEEDRDALYRSLPMERRTVNEIRKYLNAAASVYGLLPMDELLSIYNSQNPPIEEKNFMLALMAIHMDPLDSDCFDIVDVLDAVFDEAHPSACCQVACLELLYEDPEQNIRRLSRQQKGKPLKLFPKEAFLRYADDTYFPDTPEKKAMLRYLQNTMNLSREEAEDCCMDLQQLMTAGVKPKTLLAYMKELEVIDDSKWDLEAFLALLHDLIQHTHRHADRGYTPAEIHDLLSEQMQLDGQTSLLEE